MYRLIVLVIFVFISSAASAATMCTDIFSNVVGTFNQNQGDVRFRQNSRINNSDGTVDFRADRIAHDNNVNGTCGNQLCAASGNFAEELDLPSFMTTNVNNDITVSTSGQTIAAGEFDTVRVANNQTLTFTSVNGQYIIDELILEQGTTANLAPGDYWVDDLRMEQNSQITTNGDGLVRFFVTDIDDRNSNNRFINQNSRINPNQSSRNFLLVSFDDFRFGTNTSGQAVSINAFLYAVDDVTVGTNGQLTGSIVVGDQLVLEASAQVTFDGSELSFGDLCESLVASYEFEETDPTEDVINNNNGSFVGGAVDVRLDGATNSQTCSVLDVPLNVSIGNNDAFETQVNVKDQLGDQGTISFWYRSDTPWFQGFGGLDRTLFEASIPFGNNNDNEDRFFFLVLQNNGQLLFGLEDENDNNARLVSTQFNFPADEWVHVAASWDTDAREMSLFINGNEAITGFVELAINAPLSETNTLHLGDNRSSYVPNVGTSPNSGDGQFDSLRLYNFVQTEQEVDADRAATDVTSCGSPIEALAFYQFQPSEVTTDTEGFRDGALIGGATGVQLPVSVNTCGVLDIPLNQSITNNDAFDTRVNISNQIGNQGTISFWYRSDLDWNLGGSGIDRQLFDASIPFGNNNDNQDRFFFLVLQPNGRMLFGLEDIFDRNGLLETSVQNFSADEWVHIAATWNTNTAEIAIFINGTQASSNFIERNAFGQLSETTSLYIGDNRSTYLPGVGTSQNSSNGQFDEVRLYRFDQTSEQVLVDINAQPLGCFDDVLVNHYRLNFDPSFTCSVAEVEVQACANENCDLLATANSNLVLSTTNGTFSNTNLTFVGSTTSELSLSTAGSAVIDGINGSPDAPIRCFDNGVEDNTCTVNFSEVGLNVSYGDQASIVDIPNGSSQVAFDTPIFVSVDQDGACNAELNNRELEIAVQCNNPGSCNSRQLALGGARVNDIETFSPVGVTFNANGLATIPAGFLQYRDAGQIQLRFRDAQGETFGESNSFVMRPILVAVNQLNTPSVAGSPSLLEYEAVGVDGSLTPNYDPTDLQVRVVKTIPIPTEGEQGVLTLFGTNFTTQDPSTAVFQDIDEGPFDFLGNGGFSNDLEPEYSEVGTIEVQLRDADYLGSGFLDAAEPTSNAVIVRPIEMGPYIPAYFDVTNNTPNLVNTCPMPNTSNPFSYLGQNIGFDSNLEFVVTAFNARNMRTDNYGGDLWRLEIAQNDIVLTDSTTNNGQVFSTFDDNGTEDDFDGRATYTLSAPTGSPFVGFNFPVVRHTKNATPRVPESASFSVQLSNNINDNGTPSDSDDEFLIVDQDNVCFQSNFPNGCSSFSRFDIGGANLRYGRILMENAFGPESEPLRTPFRTEFFTATNVFATNSDDNCTLGVFGNADFGPPLGDNDVRDNVGTIMSSGTLFHGVSLSFEGINIPAPGAGNAGQFTLLLNQQAVVTGQPWQDFLNFDWNGDGDIDANDNPSATISFGIFRGNDRIIHWREVFN